jgi:hypothetical protein
MFCTGCGNRLGGARFCTNCGRPIPADSAPEGTAVRPAVPVPTGPPPSGPPPSGPPPSTPPPPAYEAPPPPRYPLFSDELYAAPARAADPAPPAPPSARRSGSSWLPWTLSVIVLVLIALIGGMLLVSGGDDEQAGDQAPANGAASDRSPKSPGPTPTETPPPVDGPQELARYAAASAPKTAKPNLDTQGNLVRYEARNMLDGVAQTCWRMPGDGTGQDITFTLSGPTELSEVGLINGYAKSAGKLDWYAGNRRILAVEWIFDDGTVVSQTLTETRDLQSLPITPITTSTVILRLVSVSDPGRGPSARNYTAISNVSLIGAPV